MDISIQSALYFIISYISPQHMQTDWEMNKVCFIAAA